MLYLLDKNREYVTVLENAFDVQYEKRLNKLWTASFSLPGNDPKVSKVDNLQFIEIIDEKNNDYIGLFRIMPMSIKKNISNNTITYELEHCLGTLLGSILFKYNQISGHTTSEVITWLLNKQVQKDWILGVCEVNYSYEYAWENENLLSAVMSIAKGFEEGIMWDFDTKSYPWKLNLRKLPTTPTCRIQEGYNLVGLEVEKNPEGLWNRVYPLGAGEGVNQLDIKKVNNNIPYLEDIESINKYGVYETYIVDKEITIDKNLLAFGKKKLKQWKEVLISWKISAADLSSLTGYKIDQLKLGTVVRVFLKDYGQKDLLIVSVNKRDPLGNPTDVQLELGNLNLRLEDLQAEQMRRQEINDKNAQGATNLLNFNFEDNCDQNIPAEIDFYIDDDMLNINTCWLTYKTQKFRSYSGTVKAGGGKTVTSSAGGGTTKTSSAAGGHRHRMMVKSIENVSLTVQNGSLPVVYYKANGVSIPIPDSYGGGATPIDFNGNPLPVNPAEIHTDEAVDDHSHSVTIDDHSHTSEYPEHSHDTEYKLTEKASLPTSISIEVNGNLIENQPLELEKLNLIDYLVDASGKVPRGWHTIKIIPNDEARIKANVNLRVFIQSQLGGKY